MKNIFKVNEKVIATIRQDTDRQGKKRHVELIVKIDEIIKTVGALTYIVSNKFTKPFKTRNVRKVL